MKKLFKRKEQGSPDTPAGLEALIREKQIQLENIEAALKVAIADEYRKFEQKRQLLDKQLAEVDNDRKKVEEYRKSSESELAFIKDEKQKLKTFLAIEKKDLELAKKDIENRERALIEERAKLDSRHADNLELCSAIADEKENIRIKKEVLDAEIKSFEVERKVYEIEKDKQNQAIQKAVDEAESKLQSAKQALSVAVEKDLKADSTLKAIEERALEMTHLKAQVLHLAKAHNMKKEIEALSKL